MVQIQRREVRVNGRKRVFEECQECGAFADLSNYQVDHITPVGEEPDELPNGNGDWERYIMAVDCDESNLQVLCKPCHLIKSAKESAERKERRSRGKFSS